MTEKKTTKAEEPEEVQWLDHVEVRKGLKWIPGHGNLPSDIMIIGEKPGKEETEMGRVLVGPGGDVLAGIWNELSMNLTDTYITYACKYTPPGNRALNAGDLKTCRGVLEEEIRRCNPKIIVCLGANALKAITSNKYKLKDYRDTIIKHPKLPDVKIFTTYSPTYILRVPSSRADYLRDWEHFKREYTGETEVQDITDYVVIQTVQQLRAFQEMLSEQFDNGENIVVIDCEWEGATWQTPGRYIRTVQLGYRTGAAAVVEFYSEGVVPEGQEVWTPDCKQQVMDEPEVAWGIVKEILEDPRVQIVGHNAIADGEWLLSYGVDIRPRVVYDTMLAEHTINESGPFGLTALTCKYTRMGHYDLKVVEWVDKNRIACKHGYGAVPRDLLLPYSAKDVDAPRRIAVRQLELLKPFTEKRGKYPSLWDTVMNTQRVIYELERTGMAIDGERLNEMAEAYTSKLVSLESQLNIMASRAGQVNYNHKSVFQTRDLLFKYLKLTPIKTTKGKPWGDWMNNQDPEIQALHSPSTDQITLEIHEEENPVVRTLLNVRRLDQIDKVFFRQKEDADESTTHGGLISKVWTDGRIHPHFSQLAETGRFRHSKPNCANWPKKAESYMADIFGGREQVPPGIRTLVVPAPGYVFIEADFKQAELFILAALSGDVNMWGALTTPGKDLHDLTAITAFKLQVLNSERQPVPDEYLLNLAATEPDNFEAFQKTLLYLDQKGKYMTRKEFKDGIRVSAKNLNFGIPYGRGALDIARQVKGETGIRTPLNVLRDEIQQMMDVWKEVTYPQAWAYMGACADAVEDPGYLQNPWGRQRRFPKTASRDRIQSMRRQAQNFPIQSTVADTCMVAMGTVIDYREEHNLHFRMINQIHDAIMVEAPVGEIEATKEMFENTMGNIDIPLGGDRSLRLGIDIDVLTRWGEKVKD